jgi:hypothetical protein
LQLGHTSAVARVNARNIIAALKPLLEPTALFISQRDKARRGNTLARLIE